MNLLSRGSIRQMKTAERPLNPVVQILSIKAVLTANSTGPPTRYRVLLMDGDDYISAMSATQLNEMIQSKQVTDFAVVRLVNYMIQDVAQQKMCVVLQMEVVQQLDCQIPGTVFVNADGYTTPGGNPAPSYQQSAPQSVPMHQAPPVSSYGQSYAPPVAPPQVNSYGGGYGAQSQQQVRPPAAPAAAYNQPYGGGSNNTAAAGPYGGGGANNRAVQRDDSSQNIVPISAINPYSNRWTIKARITAKSDLKRWSNAKGEGTLFSIDLLDSAGGEIRGTFFKDACEKFFPVLEEGKVYTFSGGVLKMVQNKQFSTLKNQYELTFNANSEIHPASDDANIKVQSFNFVKIDQIANMDVGNTVDLIGIVRTFTEPQEINTKAGKPMSKRDITIVDDSYNEIRLTLWGEKATSQYEWHTLPIVAVKGCKIGDYNGRTLSTSASSSITINPQSPEGHALNNFRAQFPDGNIPVRGSLSSGGGGGGNFSQEFNIEKRRAIQAIKDEQMGMGEKPDYITIKASVSYVKHDTDCWYTACPTPNCNKKVLEGMGGQWSCEKCNMQFNECHRRYIASITMADHTGSSWFSLFNESAEKMLGATAQQLYEMKTEGNEAGYDAVFSEALFKTFLCKVRVKQEAVNDEMRVKCTIMAMNSLDLAGECRQMIDAINKYN